MYIPIVNRFTCNSKQLSSYIKKLNKNSIKPIIDYVNENPSDFKSNYRTIKQTLNSHKKNHFAIKLSSLGLHLKDLECVKKDIFDLSETAIKNNSKVLIDAEYDSMFKDINNISNDLMNEFNTEDVHIYKTYQMYRKDTMKEFIDDIKNDKNYYIGAKLVRGAYYNLDEKTGNLFEKIDYTHRAYNDAIKYFTYYSCDKDKLICATHNPKSNKLVEEYIKSDNDNIAIAHLLGMSDNLTDKYSKKNMEVFKYLPYGDLKETIPYLSRRLYENYGILKYLY
uniref:Proline dehydrogenase domain-containing protein n=1 Tax=viral metagenome TaxID=1070528 RepID=A0A6C0IXD9_9ZZZZ